MTNPNFTKGIGRLATSRYDFASHYEGQAFRHTADQTDILHPSLVYGAPTTVEQALENLNTFVISEINAGAGFVIVPDGYNTYHNANGTINFDTTIPSLDLFLNPVFTSIVQIQAGQVPSTPLPAGFNRVQYGGIILIKAGTYIVANTINIPPGITLMGEGFGTRIINATSLNTSTLPPGPKVSPTPAPVFKILADPNRSSGFFADDLAVDPNLFIFQRETRLVNLVVADNFVEPTELGDNNYKLPQNLTSATTLNPPPLIRQQLGSSLTMYGVTAAGRVNFSSGQVVSQATGNLLAMDGYTFFETNTFCKVDNCFIDGFSIPIDFSGANVGDGYDYLAIKHSRIRGYGYFNGDSTDGYDNTLIKSFPQNVAVIGCNLYGNASNVTSALYLTGAATAPNKQARAKIEVVGNQITINKSSNTTNSTFKPIFIDASITSPNNLMSILVYGNSFQDQFNVYADAGSGFSSPGLGTPFISVDGYNDLATITTANGLTINGPSTINNAQTITLNGTETISSTGALTISSGGAETLNSGATLTALSGSTVNIRSGTTFSINSSPGTTNIFLGSASTFNSQSNSFVALDGYVGHTTRIVTSNFTCDSGGSDRFILANSGSSSITITLPPANSPNSTVAPGRLITIVDYTGAAGSNHIFFQASSGQTINGASGTFAISTGRGSATMVSDGISNWSIVAAYNFP